MSDYSQSEQMQSDTSTSSESGDAQMVDADSQHGAENRAATDTATPEPIRDSVRDTVPPPR
jgi:hypothetical protein